MLVGIELVVGKTVVVLCTPVVAEETTCRTPVAYPPAPDTGTPNVMPPVVAEKIGVPSSWVTAVMLGDVPLMIVSYPAMFVYLRRSR